MTVPAADNTAFSQGGQEGVPVVTSTSANPTSTVAQPQFFTAEDLAKVRQQEKDKLYPQIEDLQAKVRGWESEREAQQEVARKEREAAEESARKEREEAMSIRELLEQQRAEFATKLAEERSARERTDALLQREREFQELQQYRSTRLEEVQDQIIPTLIDLVGGNSPEEIEASIVDLTTRSNAILEDVAQAQQSSRRNMAGPRVTSPAAGPLDTHTGSQTEQLDVANMSMDDYIKNRSKLLGNASNRGRGLFG